VPCAQLRQGAAEAAGGGESALQLGRGLWSPVGACIGYCCVLPRKPNTLGPASSCLSILAEVLLLVLLLVLVLVAGGTAHREALSWGCAPRGTPRGGQAPPPGPLATDSAPRLAAGPLPPHKCPVTSTSSQVPCHKCPVTGAGPPPQESLSKRGRFCSCMQPPPAPAPQSLPRA